MREASSLVLAARLLAEGAEVRAYDPVVDRPPTGCTASRCARAPRRRMAGADAAVLVTEWSAIVDLDWAAAAADHALARGHRRPQRPRPGRDDGRSGTSFEGIGRIPAHVGVAPA